MIGRGGEGREGMVDEDKEERRRRRQGRRMEGAEAQSLVHFHFTC